MNNACALLIAALLAGCATHPQQQIQGVWALPAEHVEAAKARGWALNKPSGFHRLVQAHTVRRIFEVKEAIERQAGLTARFVIVESPSPNAFAFEFEGKPSIGLSVSLVDSLGYDRDALASIFGHELAHLKLGHRGEDRKKREDAAAAGSQILGTLLNLAGVPGGGYMASYGITGLARSFTRDEERDADALGLQWASAAGFSPCGQVHVVEMLKSASAGPQLTLLSTHPGYEERADAARAIATRSGHPCD